MSLASCNSSGEIGVLPFTPSRWPLIAAIDSAVSLRLNLGPDQQHLPGTAALDIADGPVCPLLLLAQIQIDAARERVAKDARHHRVDGVRRAGGSVEQRRDGEVGLLHPWPIDQIYARGSHSGGHRHAGA